LALLKRSGAYAQLLRDWPPAKDGTLAAWTANVREMGGIWRQGLLGFDGLSEGWQIVCQSFELPLTEARDHPALCEALMKIVATADEACEGAGATEDQAASEYNPIQDVGADYLIERGTLCFWIDPSRLRVQPRMHTPQNGLTERSLSRYVSLCDASEVTPHWHFSPFLQSDSMNLLLIPWPFEILVNQFHETADAAARLPKDFGFFTFANDSEGRPDDLTELVEGLHAEARRKLGRIDGVVLPELSITDEQFTALRQSLPQECFLIGGVGRGRGPRRAPGNEPGKTLISTAGRRSLEETPPMEAGREPSYPIRLGRCPFTVPRMVGIH
jgi:hypothetical protein